MDLSHDEIEKIINKISSGKDFIYLEKKKDFIVVHSPHNTLKQKSEIIYTDAYNRAIKEGLLPIKKLEAVLYKRGVLTEEDETTLATLRGKLEAQNVLLSKTTKVKANQDRINKVIQGLNLEINTILYKKHSKLIMSAESKSEEYKNQYLCSNCVYLGSNKFWEDFDNFLLDSEFDLKSEILSKFIALINGTDVDVIRFIARCTMWRIRFTTSVKTSEQLFGVPTTSYTTDQLNLLYWSNFYDQVYSMMPSDRPSDEVIEDNVALDAFMGEYYKDLSNEAAAQRGKKAKGTMSAFDSQEVIVTASNELYHDIEYDKPREAQRIKDQVDIKDKAKKQKKKRR